MRRQIAVTFYSDARYFGGAEVYLALLARHLDQARFRLSAILPDDPPVEMLENVLRGAGVEIRRFRRLEFRWWEGLTALRSVLKDLAGDVLHMNLPSTYDAGLSSVAVAAKMAGYSRVIATEHLPMIRRRYRRFPIKFMMSEAVDLFLVPAEASRRFLVDLHRIPWEKTRVIPLGVEEAPPLTPPAEDQVRRETGSPRGAAVIGIVGSLSARKGHRVLLEALSILDQGRVVGDSNLRIWVVGEGEDRSHLEEMARVLHLEEIVRFLGHRNDAAALIRLFDLLVVPSLIETTPFVVLEAMAAGRPVVASRIFGIPEMVVDGDTGMLVAPNDPSELAEALRRALSDSALRNRMGASGRRRYEALFTADRMASNTEAAYAGADHTAGYACRSGASARKEEVA